MFLSDSSAFGPPTGPSRYTLFGAQCYNIEHYNVQYSLIVYLVRGNGSCCPAEFADNSLLHFKFLFLPLLHQHKNSFDLICESVTCCDRSVSCVTAGMVLFDQEYMVIGRSLII